MWQIVAQIWSFRGRRLRSPLSWLVQSWPIPDPKSHPCRQAEFSSVVPTRVRKFPTSRPLALKPTRKFLAPRPSLRKVWAMGRVGKLPENGRSRPKTFEKESHSSESQRFHQKTVIVETRRPTGPRALRGCTDPASPISRDIDRHRPNIGGNSSECCSNSRRVGRCRHQLGPVGVRC